MAKQIALTVLLVAMLGVAVAEERNLSATLLYDPTTEKGTIFPKPVADSGELKYGQHRQDLSRWPSLAYDETLETKRPERVVAPRPLQGDPQRGKEIMANKELGNCGACHILPGEPQGGTGGPSLVHYRQLYDRDPGWLYQQVYDARFFKADVPMPPYGTNGVLTPEQIADVVSYLLTLD